MSNSKKSYGQIIILIVVVSLFFVPNSAFASEIDRPVHAVNWDKYAYKLTETGTFTLISEDANKSSRIIDFTYVHLSSDSDKIGSDYLVVETGVNTGRFFGEIQFGTDTDGVASLKTNVGDIVYVEYDNSGLYITVIGYAEILSSLDDESSTVQYIVVTTDKASYSVGETVRITGEVRDLYPNGTLNIFVRYPASSYIALDPQEVAIDADKKFILTHTAGGERNAEGTYTIGAVYWKNSWSSPYRVETTFDVSCLNALRCYTAIPIAQHPASYEKSAQRVAEGQALQMLMISVVVAGIGIGVFVIKRRK